MGPPSSGGLTMLMMLKIFESFDIKSMGPNSIEMVHLFSEVNRIAYADRAYYMADSDFIDVPVEGLLNKSYLEERKKSLIQEATLKIFHTEILKVQRNLKKISIFQNPQQVILS